MEGRATRVSFGFRLWLPDAGRGPVRTMNLEDTEDYDYLAMEACATLEGLGYQFSIGGFGSPDWGSDVGYDMSNLLEQLPALVAGLNGIGEGEIDFYAQGLERTVEFTRHGDSIRMSCTSRTQWRPDPETETSTADALDRMFTDFLTATSAALRQASSPIAGLHPFASWTTLTRALEPSPD
jgi:hypothetical protein